VIESCSNEFILAHNALPGFRSEPTTIKLRPAEFALDSPKPPLESSTKSERVLYRKALQTTGRTTRIDIVTEGLAPTAFGANSVASALGATPGATAARLSEHNMGDCRGRSKPELPTLLESGTFYFAPNSSSV
jgi:hypothetical protein